MTEIPERLLWWVWRQHGYQSINRYVLATVLTKLGVLLREEGKTVTSGDIVDMGGWLNIPRDCPWMLEPPPQVVIKRTWYGRRKSVII